MIKLFSREDNNDNIHEYNTTTGGVMIWGHKCGIQWIKSSP